MTNSRLPSHLQPCLKQIEKHTIISFDVFDTLLLRPVAIPCHLFWLMEKEVQSLLEDKLFDFQSTRVEAEALARKRASPAAEVTLDQIYTAFGDMTCVSGEKLEAIKQKELALELQHCFAHPQGLALYQHALEAGKEIIFTSDMYISIAFLKQLLEKNGYYTKPHRIFLSSDTLKTKHSGTVYPYIVEQLGCKPSSILHIGDNKTDDIKQGARAGFGTFYFPRNTERFFAVKRHRQIWGTLAFVDHIEMSLIIGHLAHDYAVKGEGDVHFSTGWHAFGYHVVGILYLGYIQWLMKALKREKMDAVYFLSRDGKIMKEAFDLITPFYGETMPSSYLYASRRALQMARIRKIDSLALLYISTSSAKLPVSEYLERIGMDPEAHVDAMRQVGLNGKGHIIDSPEDKQKIQQFFRLIEPEVLRYVEKEREAALGYYQSQGLLDESKRHALVDIGWGGMMLYALSDMLQKEPGYLTGFYLGTTPLAHKVANQGFPLHSYLFHLGEPHDYASAAYQCLEIVELLFSATHGSLAHFIKEGEAYIPVLDEVDCSPERIQAIEQLQAGALEFIRNMMPLLSQYPHIRIQPYVAMRPLKTILTTPTKSEVNMFRFLTHVQDISATECNRMIVPTPPSLLYLLLRPFAYADMYKRIYWKRGFQAVMGKIPRFYLRLLLRIYTLTLYNPSLAKVKRLVGRLIRA